MFILLLENLYDFRRDWIKTLGVRTYRYHRRRDKDKLATKIILLKGERKSKTIHD